MMRLLQAYLGLVAGVYASVGNYVYLSILAVMICAGLTFVIMRSKDDYGITEEEELK